MNRPAARRGNIVHGDIRLKYTRFSIKTLVEIWSYRKFYLKKFVLVAYFYLTSFCILRPFARRTILSIRLNY